MAKIGIDIIQFTVDDSNMFLSGKIQMAWLELDEWWND